MALELNPHAVYVGSHNLATQDNLGTIEPPQWCDDLFYSGNGVVDQISLRINDAIYD